MLKRVLISLAVIMAAITASAQTATYSIAPSPATYPAPGFSCGPAASTAIYCYGLPLTENGSSAGYIWVDTPFSGNGFIQWLGGQYAQGIVTEVVVDQVAPVTSNGFTEDTLPTIITVYFVDEATRGKVYGGMMTAHLNYNFVSGKGGGWKCTFAAGAMKVETY